MHADHFEPDDSSRKMSTKDQIDSFFSIIASYPWSKNNTFFLKIPMIVTDKPSNPGYSFYSCNNDSIYFGTRNNSRILNSVFLNKKKYDLDFQFHIHHERWTRNNFFKGKDISKKQQAFLKKIHMSKTSDADRLSKVIDIYKKEFLLYSEEEVRKWLFVHGAWALNGGTLLSKK